MSWIFDMGRVQVVDDMSGSFGDPDRKVIVFCDDDGIRDLRKQIMELGSDRGSIIIDNPKSENKLKIKLSNEMTTCVSGATFPILYISRQFQADLVRQLESLEKFGSYIVIEPDDTDEMECIISRFLNSAGSQ